MKTIAGYTFPETAEEATDWEPTVRRFALNRDVLVVARTRIEGKWAAYCKAVPGRNHDYEMDGVLYDGSKVPERVARVLFPDFNDIKYAG